MTLMEVMVAASVGMVVLLAMFALLDSTVRMNTNAMTKTDSMQRGRLAMDVLTQELRSQVCLVDPSLPVPPSAIVPGATSDSVEFYSDFSEGDGTVPPTKRKITFDRATGNVTTAVYKTNKLEPKPTDFNPAPSQTSLRLERAALQRDAGGNEIPFLRYYAYQWIPVPGGNPRPEATLPLVPPIDVFEARRVARVDVTLIARPLGKSDKTKGVNLSDQIMARHSDPNLAKWDSNSLPDPRCR